MQTQNSSGFKSLLAAAALLEGQRVKLNAGKWDVAGATDASPGVAIHAAAIGEPCDVKLFNAPGTFNIMASGAITAGAQLYPTASGKVDDSGTTAINLMALEAATASGDVIECCRLEIGA